MTTKQVQQILPPPPPHMVGDGFRVHNFFPGGYQMSNKRMSPFFMLDYNSKIDFSPRETPRGVGYIHIAALKLCRLPITARWPITTVMATAV
jgi:hypothetical protein